MKVKTVVEAFVLAFAVASVGFYLLNYPFQDAVLGGIVGGLGVAVGRAVRTRLENGAK